MPRATRTAVAAVSLAVSLVTLTACSGDGDAAEDAGTRAAAAATTSPAPAPAPPPVNSGAQALEDAFDAVIERVLPSVVEIRTGSGLGSGVIWDAEGNIVTNAHVIGDATTFEVQLAGQAAPVPARLVGTYPPDDLAVIRVERTEGLTPARFGDSSRAEVGDLVLAMGNPLGLSASVTNGIVSAVGRTVSEPAGEGSLGAVLPDAIQTSAAINPGNSGGALVNLRSEVIGIPTLAALSPSTGGAAPGIGFAISANRAKRIAPQLISTGRVTDSGRAALGVRVSTVADPQGQPAGVGVVSVTPGGPAAAAGIQAGDVITSVAGEETPSTSELATALAQQRVGATVDVRLSRDGENRTVKVTLGELEAG
jgi:putative serine protease PepD